MKQGLDRIEDEWYGCTLVSGGQNEGRDVGTEYEGMVGQQ